MSMHFDTALSLVQTLTSAQSVVARCLQVEADRNEKIAVSDVQQAIAEALNRCANCN
jgi:hypothetical protein